MALGRSIAGIVSMSSRAWRRSASPGVSTPGTVGRGATVSVDRAVHDDGDQRLERVVDVELAPGTPSPDSDVDGATATV